MNWSAVRDVAPPWVRWLVGVLFAIGLGVGLGISAGSLVAEAALAPTVADHADRIERLEERDMEHRQHWLYTACVLAAMGEERAGRDCDYLLPTATREMLRDIRNRSRR